MRTESITSNEGTWADESITAAVVEAVAEASNVEPTALPPLYERIDPDALDAVFASTPTGLSRTGTIEFPYFGYQVTVARDGDLSVTLDDRADE